MAWRELTREDLHEMIWTTPMRRLAPKLGVSDRGLGKVCARLEIPVPGVGYWRNVELGQRVAQAPLPPPGRKCKPSSPMASK